MVLFPNCKINLGLRVLRRREDGYHDLETVFYPIPLYDILEAVRAPELRFTPTGRQIPGDASGNLVLRAYRLLKADFPDLPPVHVYLHKRIPVGGGLGGGSSDGAFMLRLITEQFGLDPGMDKMNRYALELGSDCPFFLRNGPALGRGRGELLDPVPVDLSAYSILLVDPGIHCSTARVFALCRPDAGGPSLRSVVATPVPAWRDTLINALEAPVFTDYPVLRDIKHRLYERGALYASVTGSGSCMFGIFRKGTADEKGWDKGLEVISIPD